ncbi:hypothetical protein H6F95_01620 [Cyanobacteria bacterium FACHB-471]|nr:hypothetical protein [Cyanobacteria bacterium FACHB-471]
MSLTHQLNIGLSGWLLNPADSAEDLSKNPLGRKTSLHPLKAKTADTGLQWSKHLKV